MGTLKREEKYNCFNDCLQQGCPGHIMSLTLQDTADILMVYRDGEYLFGCDPTEWATLKKMIKSLDYNFFNLEVEE